MVATVVATVAVTAVATVAVTAVASVAVTAVASAVSAPETVTAGRAAAAGAAAGTDPDRTNSEGRDTRRGPPSSDHLRSRRP